MTFEEMKDCLECYRKDLEYLERVYEIFPSDSVFNALKCQDKLLDVVADAFDDRDDWISYFIFELEFGKNYRPGMIRGKDGTDIPLATYEDLYRLLTEPK